MIKEQKMADVISLTKCRSALHHPPLRLHPNILEILFENKHFLTKVFRDVIGFYDIAHIAISLINPSSELVIFSSMPSIEYNLINQELWQYDDSLFPKHYKDNSHHNNSFLWWDSAASSIQFEKIYYIKMQKNNYTLGMSSIRQLDNFFCLYSFATRSRREELHSYYQTNSNNLLSMGDFCYKSLRDIYSDYTKPHIPPVLANITPKSFSTNESSNYLRLMVNNTTATGNSNHD